MKHNYLTIAFLGTALLFSFPGELYSLHDTLYTCAGESIQIMADSSYAGYNWSPSSSLDNPTIYNPIASPVNTTTYVTSSITAAGENLLINGDFSEGNTGFTSSYNFVNVINTQGVYGVGPDPSAFNSIFFSACEDHTDGTGNMMVVDGFPQAQVRIWCQTVTVNSNTVYAFSTWVTSINPPNPAELQFSINGGNLGEVFNAGSEVCQWRQFYELWNSGEATEAEICIINQNIDPNGNDFALDDFSFFEVGDPVFDSVTVIVESFIPTVIDTAICDGNFIEFQGNTISANSFETFIVPSQSGCDSTIIFNVGLLDTIFEYFVIDTLCPGESLSFFGNIILSDTLLCETFPISNSCDSTYCIQIRYLTEAAILPELILPSCNGFTDGSISLAVNAGLPPYNFTWENGATESDRLNLATGNYAVTVTDAKNCVASRTIALPEPPPLESDLTATSRLCNDELFTTITLNALGGTPNYWYAINQEDFIQVAEVTGLELGIYDVIIRDENNCMLPTEITIPPPQTLSFSFPEREILQLGDSVWVEVMVNTETALQFEWQPAATVSCPTCLETFLSPLATTNYLLTGTDEAGCTIQSNFTIQVNRNLNVYIPTAFSPNGDGINDQFTLYTGQGIQQIQNLEIFDRWGEQVFSGTPGNQFKWDGFFRKDSAPTGVYTYIANVEYLDGYVHLFTGDIVLIR